MTRRHRNCISFSIDWSAAVDSVVTRLLLQASVSIAKRIRRGHKSSWNAGTPFSPFPDRCGRGTTPVSMVTPPAACLNPTDSAHTHACFASLSIRRLLIFGAIASPLVRPESMPRPRTSGAGPTHSLAVPLTLTLWFAGSIVSMVNSGSR